MGRVKMISVASIVIPAQAHSALAPGIRGLQVISVSKVMSCMHRLMRFGVS